MDMILNEKLKSSQSFLLKSFNKTFNFVLSSRQALFLHLGQMGSLFLFIKMALKMIPQIIEVLQLVVHWENYLLKYLRDRPFNLKGGGYGFLFRSEKFFRTTQ